MFFLSLDEGAKRTPIGHMKMRKAGFHCEINGLPKWVATGCTLPRITLPLYVYIYILYIVNLYGQITVSRSNTFIHPQTLFKYAFEYFETCMIIYLLFTYTVAFLMHRYRYLHNHWRIIIIVENNKYYSSCVCV